MDNREKALFHIRNVVQRVVGDAEIRLFGSRARNDAGLESDYDILVITEKAFSPKEKFPLKTKIRKELLKFGIRSDVLLQSKRDIEIKKKMPGHIIRHILKEAIEL